MDTKEINNSNNETQNVNEETVKVVPAASSIKPIKFKEIAGFLKREIRRNWILILALLVLGLGALLYNFRSSFIAATINGKPIFRWEVVKILEKQMGTQALNNIVDERLIKSEAAMKNIVVSNDEVQAKMKTVEDSIVQSGQTMDEFLQSSGTTRSEFEDRVKNLIIIEKLLADRITVTDDEVTQYIEANKESFPNLTDDAQGKSLVRESLQQQKLATEYTKYLSELKSRSSVNILVKY